MNWRIPVVALSDGPSYADTITPPAPAKRPVQPAVYMPAPVAPRPAPSPVVGVQPLPSVTVTINEPESGQTRASRRAAELDPFILRSLEARSKASMPVEPSFRPFFDIFTEINPQAAKAAAAPYPQQPFAPRQAAASVTPSSGPQRAFTPPPQSPPASTREPGTWSPAQKMELELAKRAARSAGPWFGCTNAAYAVKSKVDGLALTTLKTTLWRWKGTSGAAHSAVIVYPNWGTPETGYVLDQWWAPHWDSCYRKTERPGGFAYAGADWQKYDPTSAAIVEKRHQQEQNRRLVDEAHRRAFGR